MIDMAKVNGLIAGLEQTAKALVKIAVPTITIMIVLEVVFGVNIGLVQRILSLLGMSVKDIILYGAGAFIGYKALVK